MVVAAAVAAPLESILKRVFRPFTLPTRLLGLNNRRDRIYDWFAVAWWLTVHATGSYYAVRNMERVFSATTSTMHTIVENLQLICGLLMTIGFHVHAFRVHSTIKFALKELTELDRQLSQIRASPSHRATFIRIVLQLAVYNLSVMLLLLVSVYSQLALNNATQWWKMVVLYYVVRFSPMVWMSFMVLLFVNVLNEARVRLASVNSFCVRQIQDHQHVSERHLCLISRAYESVFEICQKCNASTAFGIINLLQIGYCFLSSTAKIFFIFITLAKLEDASVSDVLALPWLIILVAPVLSLSYYSQSLQEEARRTNETLFEIQHMFEMDPRARDHSVKVNLIESLIRQMLHQKLRISACGFFELDMGLMCLVTGAITTYLVILLQFNSKQE